MIILLELVEMFDHQSQVPALEFIIPSIQSSGFHGFNGSSLMTHLLLSKEKYVPLPLGLEVINDG